MNAVTSGVPDTQAKRTATKEFFKRLEGYLTKNLPSVTAVNKEILQAKSEYQQTGKASLQAYEGPFFKKHVVPAVHEFLKADGNGLRADGKGLSREAQYKHSSLKGIRT